MIGWTVGKPKREPWPGRKRCCQTGFEFFDHTMALAHMIENRQVKAYKLLIFRNQIVGFSRKKAKVRQSP